ncbi:MAG TPA: hypothetical protein PLA88_02410 [Bacteroidales bacterium]|nr:hypothetical protein [Bacteroidales bacterium]
MSYHTILIGTSKTVEGDEYFCKGRNVKLFWGTLNDVIKSDFSGKEAQTEKLSEKGVLITDISSEKGGVEKQDKQIKVSSIQDGFIELERKLLAQKELKRVAFIGKLAAKWFFIRFIDKIDLKNDESTYNSEFFHYGKQKWTLKVNNSDVTCYTLQNTGRQWDSSASEWKEFWKDVFEIKNNG